MEVVRSNYDTLTLKLQDSLDHFDKYAERQREGTFFTQLVRITLTSAVTIQVNVPMNEDINTNILYSGSFSDSGSKKWHNSFKPSANECSYGTISQMTMINLTNFQLYYHYTHSQ